jgi:hypothetical protein
MVGVQRRIFYREPIENVNIFALVSEFFLLLMESVMVNMETNSDIMYCKSKA